MFKKSNSVLAAIVLVIVLQSCLLILMIANRQAILLSDTIVVLETQPIDPRSLFRGDYVRLNYHINDLKLKHLEGDKSFKVNELIYVVLEQKEKYWRASAVYSELPELTEKMSLTNRKAVIQGVVKKVNNKQWNWKNLGFVKANNIKISYGIENYFVPEGEGLKLERPKEGDKVTLEIALDKKGHAAIKTLLLNGEAQYQESLF